MRLYLLVFIIIFTTIGFVSGQPSNDFQRFNEHFQQAKNYEDVSLFAESIKEITLAIQIAKLNKWKKKTVKASIFLAELKRKTEDFEEGISILRESSFSSDYPQLHVQKLGRMAALYHESNLPDQQKFDSVEHYIHLALTLAEKHDFRTEKASLYNELGYRIGHRHLDSCLYLLGEASNIFKAERDTQNYIAARTNMLRTYETIGDSLNTLSTFNELNTLLQGKQWYTFERELYVTMASYYSKKKDTIQAYYWKLQSLKSQIQNIENISSTRLNSYRALYETEKYQQELERKAVQLNKAANWRNQLILYFLALLALSLGVTIWLIRVRKLKKKVAIANDNYQMLLVESNHRIKNNLQMIISMLQYASKDLKEEEVRAFKLMSGKIQTISILHKHLHLDVHNELMDLKNYFISIIFLYQDISSNTLQIKVDIDDISIKSERIVYFGLIFNEMLSNTFEHGKVLENTIYISIKDIDNKYYFSYQDNSCFNSNKQHGTGITMIKQLVSRIKGRNFNIDEKIGKFEFDF